MAEFVLGWANERVRAAMHGANNQTHTLPKKIPVYIVYFTAYARDGQLYFSDDVYGRDDALEEQMADTIPKRSA
jgi:murein L,D-transpeptidase YcbB/YkuD